MRLAIEIITGQVILRIEIGGEATQEMNEGECERARI